MSIIIHRHTYTHTHGNGVPRLGRMEFVFFFSFSCVIFFVSICLSVCPSAAAACWSSLYFCTATDMMPVFMRFCSFIIYFLSLIIAQYNKPYWITFNCSLKNLIISILHLNFFIFFCTKKQTDETKKKTTFTSAQ